MSDRRVLISGASGLIGTALGPALASDGLRVERLTRGRHPHPAEIAWDPRAGLLDLPSLEGLDAVVHLAGESIAQRWTRSARQRIRESRVRGTRLLSESLARLERPPRAIVAASAVGYYGSRGDERLREDAPPGTGFLAEVARDWEAATDPARNAGIRVVNLRTGVVLSARGGALAKLLPLFRLGLGGPLGDGRQWMSWILIDDLVAAIRHLLAREDLGGPVNAVAPEPVSNAEFARMLGAVLGRPAALPAPAFALRLLMGREMADATLLGGQRVLPARLLDSGFRFLAPTLAAALRRALARDGTGGDA
ncbi:MAG: TIGR01777 family protein [Candidatus Eisenbacteria bacterium RBG_16_71_46]|nr:MAG: TIGR01777 family protein [Candidatus Eisenbacteria bacterium RBG_16_71_46]OGF22727.1 MAG: TIGR01777 family protein [Candidatus Eisenbacteria bacterium RBG_19FT_COMBO_70_11]